jgi:hypothetical protein
VRGRSSWLFLLIVAHAAPAAVVWGVIGLALAAIRRPHDALLIAGLYATIFGASEALSLRLRPPTSTWQVPRHWVGRHRGLRRQAVGWGATLGPGLLTRNPYASIWLVVPLLAASNSPQAGLFTGIAVGVAHGAMRAGGIGHNALKLPGSVHTALAGYFGWRLLDGECLLLLGTYILVALAVTI